MNLSRQAAQQALQLVQHDGLLVSRSRRLVASVADAHADPAAVGVDDLPLPGQAGAVALGDVVGGQAGGLEVDAAEHEGELARVVARRIINLAEVDVQEGVGGEVGGAALDDLGGQVEGEVGVDLGEEGRLGVPGGAAAAEAREGDGRDALLDGVDGGADGAREGHLDVQVRADVGPRHGQLGRRVVPQLGREVGDAVADGRHWVRVDPVETRVRGVAARGAAVGRAAVVLARRGAVLGVAVQGTCWR